MSGAPEVLIFTDGGCNPNPGPGGWGAILWFQDQELELGGAAQDTTNNRMEITAALRGLEALNRPTRVTVVTDSEYLFNTMTNWIAAWSANGWRRKKKPVLNKDLWLKLAEVATKHQTSWSWTRGHSGHPQNERCDEIASAMILRADECEDSVLHKERRTISEPWPSVESTPTASIQLDLSQHRRD